MEGYKLPPVMFNQEEATAFLIASLMAFSRWLMLFADHAQIIEPFELKDMIAKHAEGILKKPDPASTQPK